MDYTTPPVGRKGGDRPTCVERSDSVRSKVERTVAGLWHPVAVAVAAVVVRMSGQTQTTL